MTNHFNIFYSWQSDIDKKVNNYFIKDCLEKAIKEIGRDKSLNIVPRLDKDTEGKMGSPNIVDSIFEKISNCQIFVADVTIINNSFLSRLLKQRLMPNPNVLIELGYAVNCLSWERVICINNNSISNVEDLPFDIKQNRITTYTYDGKEDKAQAKERVVALFKMALRAIIDKYDDIVSNINSSDVYAHDKRVFDGYVSIISGDRFIEFAEEIAAVQVIEREGYRLLDSLVDYLTSDDNLFMNEEIRSSADELAYKIASMKRTFAVNFHAEYEEYFDAQSGEMIQRYYYRVLKEPQYFNTYQEYDENLSRITRLIDDSVGQAIEQYKVFRGKIKKCLYI
jgi:hypothetical protein